MKGLAAVGIWRHINKTKLNFFEVLKAALFPFEFRVFFKIVVLTFRALYGAAPPHDYMITIRPQQVPEVI